MEPGVDPREAQPAEEGGRQPEWEPGQDQRVVPERGLMEESGAREPGMRTRSRSHILHPPGQPRARPALEGGLG